MKNSDVLHTFPTKVSTYDQRSACTTLILFSKIAMSFNAYYPIKNLISYFYSLIIFHT